MDIVKKQSSQRHVGIIGAGPAGLIASDVLSQAGCQVSLFDQMPSAGRKFLIASKGGLNLTHSLPLEQFLQQYRQHRPVLAPYLLQFGPQQLREWIGDLGFETFTGSSGKVFPEDMKGGNILHALMERLSNQGVSFYFSQRWVDWQADGSPTFLSGTQTTTFKFDAVLFALGGASWPQLGSDASWAPIFSSHGIALSAFKPANCGFNTNWTDHFRTHFAGTPVKPVSITFRDLEGRSFHQTGEFLISDYGVEGSLIYAASAFLREMILKNGSATIQLDLAPQWSTARIAQKLSTARGKRSLTTHLRKTLGFSGIRTALMYELLAKDYRDDPALLAQSLKSLPLRLNSARPIAEAISTAGGLRFNELDQNLMLKKFPGCFCAGEMLDWEAPTGGFLLTACFSTGMAAAKAILSWLQSEG